LYINFASVLLQVRSQIIKHCESFSTSSPSLIIFPEGSTTPQDQPLASFKTGAFAPLSPVQPFSIAYANVEFSSGSGILGDVFSIANLLKKSFVQCEVRFLAVHTPSAEERADVRVFAETVRSEISASRSMITGLVQMELSHSLPGQIVTDSQPQPQALSQVIP
jgi:hypothetical protein